MCSTRSPFVTLLSRRAHSGRETGVVHRITYSFNYCLFNYVLFSHFILDIK